MKTNFFTNFQNYLMLGQKALKQNNLFSTTKDDNLNHKNQLIFKKNELPEIVLITTFPPTECGIATYSQDLKNALEEKFGTSFRITICGLNSSKTIYPDEVKYNIQSEIESDFEDIAKEFNENKAISMVFLQHEFGLFGGENGSHILTFLKNIKKPVVTTFHTVLPEPNPQLKKITQEIANNSASIIVMTNSSSEILKNSYEIEDEKIEVIAHGTHLVSINDMRSNNSKIHLADRIVLTTFGLLNEGKSIETAIDALPKIIEKFPNVIYLIIGKTHPEVVKKEGEKYRHFLYEKVQDLGLQNNVRFINRYLSLNELIDYLQRTTIYLFTSKDPNQAVSGTLSYALACGCPVIATPIPHAKELIYGSGVTVAFQDAEQLADAAITLLFNPKTLTKMRLNALQKINSSSWQNAAIAHIELSKKTNSLEQNEIKFTVPEISLKHIKKLTTNDGILQFSMIDSPDLESGYTIDDNARALIALAKHYQIYRDASDLIYIEIYLNYIIYCQLESGNFLNYTDKKGVFLPKNSAENLEDANGRAIWALGEFCSYTTLFDDELQQMASKAIEKAIKNGIKFNSPRAIAFTIKGLYFYNINKKTRRINEIITQLADNLVSKFRGVSDANWKWFENYLTYANSVLPEALLYAYLSTNSTLFKNIAKTSFDFFNGYFISKQSNSGDF